MGGVLIDDDERIFGLGDDEGVLKLGPRCAERIVRAHRFVGCGIAARVAARLGESCERRLCSFSKTEAPCWGMVIANDLVWHGSIGLRYSLQRGLRERGRSAMTRLPKGVPQRADEQRAHGIRIAESELGLGRMHVNVHPSGGMVRNSASIGWRPLG